MPVSSLSILLFGSFFLLDLIEQGVLKQVISKIFANHYRTNGCCRRQCEQEFRETLQCSQAPCQCVKSDFRYLKQA